MEVEELINQAREAIHKNQLLKARFLYEKAIKESKDNISIQDEYANLLLETKGEIQRSKNIFENLRMLDPYNADYPYKLGLIACYNKNLSEAAIHFTDATKLDQNNSDHLFNLARVYYTLDNEPLAIDFYKRGLLIDLDSIDLNARFVKIADDSLKMNQHLQSIYNDLIKSEGETAGLLFGKAALYMDAKEYKQAEKTLLKCYHFKNDSSTLTNTLAECYSILGKLAKAEKFYLQSIDIADNNIDTTKFHIKLATLFGKGFDQEKALKYIEIAFNNYNIIYQSDEDVRNKIDLLFYLINGLREVGQVDLALKQLNLLQHLLPDNHETHLFKAYCYLLVEQKNNVIQECYDFMEKKYAHYYKDDFVDNDINDLMAVANLLYMFSETWQADTILKMAYDISPGNRVIVWQMALNELLKKDYLNGFKLYEARRMYGEGSWLEKVETHMDDKKIPMIEEKEDILNKNILIILENRLTDNLLFYRFLNSAKKEAKSVKIVAESEMANLYTKLLEEDCIPLNQDTTKDIDCYQYLASLPASLKLDMVPDFKFINTKPISSSKLIGFAWKIDNRNKSIIKPCFLTDMLPYLLTFSTNLISIQNGYFSEREQLELKNNSISSPLLGKFKLMALVDEINKVDLVFAIDNQIAEIAAFLGKEVHLLLSPFADWQWGKTDKQDWYDNVTIYRKSLKQNWENFIDNVVKTLS